MVKDVDQSASQNCRRLLFADASRLTIWKTHLDLGTSA